MKTREMDGPPWGTYVDPDEAYLRGQAGSAGSGLLGGWSQGGFGGSFGVRPPNTAEVRDAVADLTSRPPELAADPADEP